MSSITAITWGKINIDIMKFNNCFSKPCLNFKNEDTVVSLSRAYFKLTRLIFGCAYFRVFSIHAYLKVARFLDMLIFKYWIFSLLFIV